MKMAKQPLSLLSMNIKAASLIFFLIIRCLFQKTEEWSFNSYNEKGGGRSTKKLWETRTGGNLCDASHKLTLSCFSLASQTRLPKAALDGVQEAYAWFIQHPLISCSNFGGIIMALFRCCAPNTEQQTSLLCEKESRMRIPMAYSF